MWRGKEGQSGTILKFFELNQAYKLKNEKMYVSN